MKERHISFTKYRALLELQGWEITHEETGCIEYENIRGPKRYLLLFVHGLPPKITLNVERVR